MVFLFSVDLAQCINALLLKMILSLLKTLILMNHDIPYLLREVKSPYRIVSYQLISMHYQKQGLPLRRWLKNLTRIFFKYMKNNYFAKKAQMLVIGDYQHFKGYTLFLCKEHAIELHHLQKEYKLKYLE